ncbi:glycerophosphodiester phosphodiesterase [Coraliomargarita parva]|uniref:glycerophosphodiester phosphodiesterase n=1 Tax=Coraliomargarita parva TaxID=3014050 RepID=UPI0022B2B34B|nr:glycerophosphodiester phosphodiesterase family protein [Coraliomargarita parva]
MQTDTRTTNQRAQGNRSLLFACACLLLFAAIALATPMPVYLRPLSEVMEHEIGRNPESIPRYRCTVGAHRGASLDYLENTLDALQAAETDPRYAFIEFDVQYTKDGEIVVFHDQLLLRIFRKLGSINNSTYEELAFLTDGQIARYSEVMDVLHKKLNIEIKSQGDAAEDQRLADALIADIRARGREKDVMVSSIEPEVIHYINVNYPTIPTGQIYWITSSTYLHFEGLTQRLYKDFSESEADYLMLHVANFRNLENLLKFKPPNKTIIFWNFDDGIYLVHQNRHDQLWGENWWSRLLVNLQLMEFPSRGANSDPVTVPRNGYRPDRLSVQ